MQIIIKLMLPIVLFLSFTYADAYDDEEADDAQYEQLIQTEDDSTPVTDDEQSIINKNLASQYSAINRSIPDNKVSLIEILNSSELYNTMTGSEIDEPAEGILARLINITDKLLQEGEVSVTLKLQYKFYPEGTLANEQEILNQRQRILDVLIPIIQDKMLNSQQMLDSLQIYDYIPYFTITLNKDNFWYLLDSKGIVDIQLNSLSEPLLAQSTPLIGATTAWSSGADGAGQVVAVLDTGVKKDHQFLTGKVVSEACYSKAGGYGSGTSLCPGGVSSSTASGSGVNCSSAYSACDHGTHVAGIVAGKGSSFSGVAKEAQIIAIQVFTNISGSIRAYDSDVQKGLERVYALRSTYNIASVNMSLGGGKYTSYCNNDSRKAIIDNLLSVGIATVIASGNDGYTNGVSSPGCIETAITVGATSDGGYGAADTVTSYSNSASMVDLLAPGSLINSSVISSASAYANKHGTSMATPHVAGAFALLKSSKNNMTVQEGLNALLLSGVNVTDSKNGITKKRINVHGAVSSLGSGTVTVNTNVNGAQWSLDNSTWKNSGETISDVLLGVHKLYFKSVSHSNPTKKWLTPSEEVEIEYNGHNVSVTATYEEADKKLSSKDFDGDSKADILLRNTSDGRHLVLIMNGSTVTPLMVRKSDNTDYKISPTAWVNKGLGDFDGDGKSDILLRNTSDGRHLIMLMDGNTVTPSMVRTSDDTDYKISPSTWVNKGLGDFDGDGKTDILLRHATDGRHLVMMMNGRTVTPYVVRTSDDTDYKISPSTWGNKGLGDFDGDGKTDIVLRSSSDGRHLVLFMNGRTVNPLMVRKSDNTDYKISPSAWVSKGLGDFDSDGKTDIVLRNSSDGRHLVLFMDGRTVNPLMVRKSDNTDYKISPSAWVNKGFGDFDGDGKSDILLRNSSDGRHLVMIMDGRTVTPSVVKDNSNVDYKLPPSTWLNKGFGDFDGDGKSDILLRNSKDGKHILLQMNTSTVTPEVAVKSDNSDYSISPSAWVNK